MKENFIPIFSHYINLERETSFSDSLSAIAASRARLFTFLYRTFLKVMFRNRLEKEENKKSTACLLCFPDAPIQHFLQHIDLSDYPIQRFNIPSCYKKADAPSAGFVGQNNRDKFRLSFVPEASLTSASVPEKWSSSNAIDKILLPVPTSPALHALLDLLRKLLAWSPNQGFADGDANNAVAAIDTVRFLLHRSDATALQKLKKKAANEGSSRCFEIADLALKQIEQRNSHKTQENAASPNADGVTAALEKCIKAANTAAHKKGAVTAAAKGAVKRANSVASRRLSSAPLQISVPRTFEILPFAIPSGGMWVAHRFTLECDVINGATGLGVWVTWRKGSKVKGMGYIEETFDEPPTQPTTYTCSKRYLWSVKATSCKALKLLDATPRGALKPTNGFLKIFSKNGASSSLIEAVKTMAAVCLSANGDEALRQFKMDLVGLHEDRKVMGKAKGRRNTV